MFTPGSAIRRVWSPSCPGPACFRRTTTTSRIASTRIRAASSASRAAEPFAKRKCAAPWVDSPARSRPFTTHAPPPSILTPARPSASPISARAPGRSSRAMDRSNIGGSFMDALLLGQLIEKPRQQLRHRHDVEHVVVEHRDQTVRLSVFHVFMVSAGDLGAIDITRAHALHHPPLEGLEPAVG